MAVIVDVGKNGNKYCLGYARTPCKLRVWLCLVAVTVGMEIIRSKCLSG
jgi:hypothetical protein